MAVYKRGEIWWFKFTWNGEAIRESTKQGNKRVAEQIEAARKTQLAKGEVGIRDRVRVQTLKEFANDKFLPFVKTTFASKAKTASYYRNGLKNLLAHEKLAGAPLDSITTETISGFIAKRQAAGLLVSSINRELQVLRRMFALAVEWKDVEKALPRVKMLPGEQHRERVLSAGEETAYLASAGHLLRDVAIVLLDCALRPEECFRLKVENIREGQIEIQYGKTDNARRRIPLSQRAAAVLDMRVTSAGPDGWLFPAPTKSGHIEPSSLKKQHAAALRRAGTAAFVIYSFRHTCLTRWAPVMDPWTLAYLAGHRDMSITKRYVHPQEKTVREAMERAQEGHYRKGQGGHNSGHTAEKPDAMNQTANAIN